MRVMCIKMGRWRYKGQFLTGPKYGEICLVVKSVLLDGDTCYILEKYSPEDAFLGIAFIPLSEIDETEMIRESLYQQNLS